MDALATKIDAKLRTGNQETDAEVRERILEVIELPESVVLDLLRSRASDKTYLTFSRERQPDRGFL